MPTPEQMVRSRYERIEVEKGTKAMVNTMQSPLRAMEGRGVITSAQREAGEVYEALYRVVWGGSRSDILALVVRGIAHETDAQVDRVVKAKRLMEDLARQTTQAARRILLDVCVSGLFIGPNNNANRDNYANLYAGLDACVAVFGIPLTRKG